MNPTTTGAAGVLTDEQIDECFDIPGLNIQAALEPREFELFHQGCRALLSAASAQPSIHAESFVLRALVAAGHVSQDKVDEAFRIAASTPGIAPVSDSDVRRKALEECCAAIKAEDDRMSADDYMLDSDDCIRVIRALSAQQAKERT